MGIVNKFIGLYEEVFNEDGTTKLCGREKCKELIKAAETIDVKTSYGDGNTGIMNIDNLKILRATL